MAQVMRDLGRFWQRPAFTLELAGVGAGRWLIGTGVPVAAVHTDAVEFMRLLSGRPTDIGLAVTGDRTIIDLIRSARGGL